MPIAELNDIGTAPVMLPRIGLVFVRLSFPLQDIFLLAAKRLGVEPAKCCVIEDTVSGVQAAKGFKKIHQCFSISRKHLMNPCVFSYSNSFDYILIPIFNPMFWRSRTRSRRKRLAKRERVSSLFTDYAGIGDTQSFVQLHPLHGLFLKLSTRIVLLPYDPTPYMQ